MTSPENLGRQFDDHVMVPIHEVESFLSSDFQNHKGKPLKVGDITDEMMDDADDVHEIHDPGTVDRWGDLYISIRKHGIKSPVIAHRDVDGKTWLDDGHHRVSYARVHGLTNIPVRYE